MPTAEGIFDAERVLVEPAEAEWAQGRIRFVVVDFDQAAVFATERLVDMDPLGGLTAPLVLMDLRNGRDDAADGLPVVVVPPGAE